MAHTIRLATLLGLAALVGAAGPPPGGANPSFNLVNRTGQPIRELFVTPAGNAAWGQNRLDGRNGNPTGIAVGGNYTLRRRADNNCIFDIKLVLGDGRSEERKGVNTCAMEEVVMGAAAGSAGPAPGPAIGKAADDPSVKLFNRAAVAITEFYAVPAGGAAGEWGVNRVDRAPLPPDQNRLVSMARDGNCIYDLRVVFADKKAREKKRTNLCRLTELPIP